MDYNLELKEEVLGASSITYADNWMPVVTTLGGGSQWGFYESATSNSRPSKSYLYESEREASLSTDISKDGTFLLQAFDPGLAQWGDQPNWTNANTITAYTRSGFEKEDRDVLGIYSAALYGYNDQLVMATGHQARHNEMAFSSFESMEEGVSGNWQFAASDGVWGKVEVRLGNEFFAIVDRPLSELGELDTVMVIGSVPNQQENAHFVSEKSVILCRDEYQANSQYSTLVLDVSPHEGLWTGSLYYKKPAKMTSSKAELDSTFSHSGSTSLKVTGRKVYEQNVLQLDTAKSYRVAAWMSDRKRLPKFGISNGSGIKILFSDKEGQLIDSVFFRPKGVVTEGWQKTEGRFSFPKDATSLAIVFSAGQSKTVWVDDLRLLPVEANMKSYVYEKDTYRLSAVLDEENFATFYHYDEEGNLFLVKKETIDGIKTITETIQYQIERE